MLQLQSLAHHAHQVLVQPVVSSITSWPIQASGIFPSESEALGLSLSIIAPSSFRFRNL